MCCLVHKHAANNGEDNHPTSIPPHLTPALTPCCVALPTHLQSQWQSNREHGTDHDTSSSWDKWVIIAAMQGNAKGGSPPGFLAPASAMHAAHIPISTYFLHLCQLHLLQDGIIQKEKAATNTHRTHHAERCCMLALCKHIFFGGKKRAG